MLVHLRLTVPPDLSEAVLKALEDDPRLTNLAVLRGVSVRPPGDLIELDVAREAANSVLSTLADLGVGKRGGIIVSPVGANPFDAAAEVDKAAHGDPDDAVVWDVVVERAVAASKSTWSFHLFLTIAVTLAAIAVITDSAILVVGAMVVGPEFATVAAVCVGLVFLRWRLTWDAVRLLLFGFGCSIAIVTVLALIGRIFGLVTFEAVTRPRPFTGFVWHPDIWSLLVAILAGAAGVMALSTEKAQAMVGVFISVTTVPAAGNLALALAVWSGREITGSLAQLGINVLGMVTAGVVVLALQRVYLARFGGTPGRHLHADPEVE